MSISAVGASSAVYTPPVARPAPPAPPPPAAAKATDNDGDNDNGRVDIKV